MLSEVLSNSCCACLIRTLLTHCIGVWINNVPTQDSMCSWFTYSTPDANKDHVLQTNTSIGPMYANINSAVKAFESQNCQPWTRVP
jgi:hypothetical protein